MPLLKACWTFAHPFIGRRWLDIALNSLFKYKTCCLPILIDYCRAYGFPPVLMGFALSAALCSIAPSVSKNR